MVSRNTTSNVVQYLLLRLHVSALALGHHQVSNCASEETIQCINCNEISLHSIHCIVSSKAQFETWWWPSARAETCSLSNKYYTTLLVVFRLYYPVSSYLFTLSLVYWRASTLKPDPSVWMIFRRTRNFMPQILDRQSQWLRYLRRGSAAAGFLGLYL